MSNRPSELWRWDAVDLAEGIRTRQISSREATVACLDRIEAVNPILNAITLALPEEALAAADAADRAVADGETLGIVHGVPITTKLNADQAGVPSSTGVVAYKDRVATDDNTAIANLRKAGAVVIGRTNTPPFCMRWETENDLHGRTLNPWSRDHVPGGSTGGGASAVAAGMGPLTQGGDCGGSIRYPAFCTGIAGLRPTFGRVPFVNPGQQDRPLSAQLTAVGGPLARRVRDLRPALVAMAQRDGRDPWWVPAPLEGAPLDGPIRVALCTDPTGDGVEPSVAASLARAAEALAAAGYVVAEPPLPSLLDAAEIWDQLCQGETRAFLRDTVARLADPAMRTATGFMLARVGELDADTLVSLYVRRAGLIRRWTALLEDYPILLSPVSTRAQFMHGEDILSQEANDEAYRVQTPLTGLSLIGVPGVAVPTGVVDDLPTGVLVSARHFREDLALDAAEAIEAAFPMPTPVDIVFESAREAAAQT